MLWTQVLTNTQLDQAGDAIRPMDAAAWIERYRGFWEGQFDQLADYLKKQESKEDDHG